MPDLHAILISTQFQNSIASGLVLAVVGILLRVFNPKARLIWGIAHEFHFLLRPNQQAAGGENPPPPIAARTRAVSVRSVGSAAAESVEIYLSHPPQHFHLWPAVAYTQGTNPENQCVISIANLGRGEHITMEMLQIAADLPIVLRVRSKTGEAEAVALAPARVFPQWFNIGAGLLVLFGAWMLIRIVLDFVRVTPSH